MLKVSTNLPHSAGSSPYTSSGWLGTALLGDRWLGGGVVTKLSGKEDGELLSNSPFRKAKMAVTKNSMVGKGNIWIFPGEVMVWLFDCYHWALLWENFTPAGCGFARGACSCCQCSSVSSLQEVVACGGCRDRTNVGRKAREGPGVVTTWEVKDGDVSNLEVLSSYCLFFFGGMKNQFQFFLILCFWMLVKEVALVHFLDWRSLLDDVQHHPCC